MSLCTNCGKENRAGAKFCQACGTPLAEVPKTLPQTDVPRKKQSTSELAGATCASCGTLNAPGMKFCKMCGTPLAAPKGAEDAPKKRPCPSCGGDTPAGYKFCQHCGSPLGSAVAQAPEPAAAVSQPEPQPEPAPQPTEVSAVPAAVKQGPTASEQEGPPESGAAVAKVGASQPLVPTAPPGSLSPPFAQKTTLDPPASVAPGSDTVGPQSGRAKAASKPAEPLAKLVTVNRDGSDGDTHPVLEETVDMGRTEGQLTFGDDPYLSPRHARLSLKNGSWRVEDLGSTNGVYLRITSAQVLRHGDVFLCGKQVMRFEFLADHERELTPAVEHGVLVFGSPLRTPWARLVQYTVAGVGRDVYHLYRPQIGIGREEGDLLFVDDEFMSRRHMRLDFADGKALLEDLGSSNGTYLRAREEHVLVSGDMIRIGDQLLRFESP